MNVYVVFREGVYRHQCGGVFSTLDRARTAARFYLSREPDSYHEYGIVTFVVDEQSMTLDGDSQPQEPDEVERHKR